MPPLDISLRNLFQSGQRLGELQFTLHQTADAMTLEDVSGELALLRLPPARPAQLVWHRGAGGYTELQARLAFEDIGQTLGFFDYQRIVETEGGEFDVTLRWPGSPQQFSLEAAQGELVARIGSGSFLEAPASASGALRVVSILNLADIVQRLSLSNMFEAGIPFDSVQGEIEVRDGLLTVSRMDVEGGSSFRFSGVSDLRTQSLDVELVARLSVANNLPWIAALAASLPVAAGVFVVSQVFNKQMNRLSSAVYSIGGDWNDPEVTFDRMFDNTPRTGSAAADRTAGEEAAVAPALDSGVQEASPQDGEAGQGAQSGSP